MKFIKSIAIVLLASTCASFAIGNIKSDEVFARSFGSPSQATLEKALTAIGSAEKTLVVDGGVWPITDDVEFPSTLTMDVRKGSMFNISTGVNLYIYGHIIDVMHQIFNGDKNTSITIADPSRYLYSISGLDYARPEWFGDGSRAINQAMYSASVVKFSSKTYTLDDYVVPISNVSIVGEGKDATILRTSSDLSGFRQTIPGNSFSSITPIIHNFPIVGGATSEFYGPVDNFSIIDLCIDGNYNELQSAGWTNLSVCNIAIHGENNSATRCQFKGFGSATGGYECFPVTFRAYDTNDDQPNVIDSCEYGPSGDMPLYGVGAIGGQLNAGGGASWVTNTVTEKNQWTTYTVATEAYLVIKNCVVRDISILNTSGESVCTSVWGLFSGANIVENNVVYDSYGTAFYANDTTHINPLIIKGNICYDIDSFVELMYDAYGGTYKNVLIENNYARLLLSGSTGRPINVELGMWQYSASEPAYQLSASDEYPLFDNIVIQNNTFELNESSYAGDWATGISIWDTISGRVDVPTNSPINDIVIRNNNIYGTCVYITEVTGEHENIDQSELRIYDNTSAQNIALKPNMFNNGTYYEFEPSVTLSSLYKIDTDEIDIDKYTKLLSYATLMDDVDGGCGTLDGWSLSYGGVDAIFETSEEQYLFDRSSCKAIYYTNSASMYIDNIILNPNTGITNYTIGGWFYCPTTNFTLNVRVTLDDNYGIYDWSKDLVIDESNINQWNLLSYNLSVPSNTTTNWNKMECRFGCEISRSTPEIDDYYYMDNLFLVNGKLPYNSFPYVGEHPKVNASITTITPKRFGEQVYNESDNRWYRAHGTTTNDWDALN